MAFSWSIFAGLLLIVLATFGMTELLASRWTTWRRYFVLRDWCTSRRLWLVNNRIRPAALPEAIEKIDVALRIRWHFTDGRITVLRLQGPEETFNLLLLPVAGNWPATGLRPSQRQRCMLDRLGLFNYPSPTGVARFTLHGTDPPAARKLNESQMRGLLPADLTLILLGQTMVIDFSARPFDPIELDRMIALANQLSAALPTL